MEEEEVEEDVVGAPHGLGIIPVSRPLSSLPLLPHTEEGEFTELPDMEEPRAGGPQVEEDSEMAPGWEVLLCENAEEEMALEVAGSANHDEE